MAELEKDILIVGVTGSIGSGKSTVCKILEREGIPVFHADDIAKEVSVTDPILKEQIIDLLGTNAYTAEGALNRFYIAEKIFATVHLRKKYEAILHPRVKEEIEKKIAALDHSRTSFVVIEAALLYEATWDAFCDTVIVVEAPEEVCIERVCQRNGVRAEEVRARIQAQMRATQKSLRADFVLHNTGSYEELERNVHFLIQLLKQRKGETNSG